MDFILSRSYESIRLINDNVIQYIPKHIQHYVNSKLENIIDINIFNKMNYLFKIKNYSIVPSGTDRIKDSGVIYINYHNHTIFFGIQNIFSSIGLFFSFFHNKINKKYVDIDITNAISSLPSVNEYIQKRFIFDTIENIINKEHTFNQIFNYKLDNFLYKYFI